MKTRGFTLVEVLVVLVLISMIMGLLMQGLGFVYNLQGRTSQVLQRQQGSYLQQGWLRGVLQAVYPEQTHRSAVFKGNRTQLSGLTMAPLGAANGTPTEFSLRFERQDNHTRLVYQEAQQPPWVLGVWQGDSGAFRFQSEEGRWSDVWPQPLNRPLQLGEEIDQLPGIINVAMVSANEPVELWVPVTTRKRPVVDYNRLLEAGLLK